jgi:hypothetical protein
VLEAPVAGTTTAPEEEEEGRIVLVAGVEVEEDRRPNGVEVPFVAADADEETAGAAVDAAVEAARALVTFTMTLVAGVLVAPVLTAPVLGLVLVAAAEEEETAGEADTEEEDIRVTLG